MKKIAFAIVLTLGLALNGTAQEKQLGKREASEKLSMEQRNQLQLKKMTLDLDLNASQQKEMATIIAEQNAEREAKLAERKAKKEATKEAQKPLTADEKFAMQNKRLDRQIEQKAKMKKILNDEQMKKWEANQEKRRAGMHKMNRQHRQKSKMEEPK